MDFRAIGEENFESLSDKVNSVIEKSLKAFQTALAFNNNNKRMIFRVNLGNNFIPEGVNLAAILIMAVEVLAVALGISNFLSSKEEEEVSDGSKAFKIIFDFKLNFQTLGVDFMEIQ
jgi:hypothetical protein